MILIPVKNLATAKQRLASLLDQTTRTKLAQAMLTDVLQTLRAWPNCPDVALVTNDRFSVNLAKKFDFEVIPDKASRSETAAIEMATKVCIERGISDTLVIPADIPLLQAWELDKILDTSPREGSVLVPSADRRGTNAAWRRPAGLFALRFGNDSFRPHLAAARASRKPCVVLTLPGIALDIDNPADLRQLVAAPGDTRAQRLARQLDLSDLPAAANQ
jgi:2-phospho-L-lactate guanylyltransferase